MSLLADLLAKYRAGSSADSGEKTPRFGIPPTLFRTRAVQAKGRRFDRRYLLITAICLSFVTLGYFVVAKLVVRNQPVKTVSPASPAAPLPPKPVHEPVAVAPVQPRITLTPPVVPIPADTGNKAGTSLVETPAVASSEKKKQRHVAAHTSLPRTAQIPAQQAAPAHQQKATQAIPPKTPSAAPVDMAARDSYLYAARAAELAGDWRTALASYRKAQKIDPENYVIMNNTAAALNNLGMFTDSIQEAERALVKKPDYAPALINAAIGYSSTGNSQKAVRLFTSASVFDPGNRNLVINLGILHERNGDLDAALATYRKLADDGDPLALQGIERIYELKGKRLEAARACRQIMALPGASPGLKKEAKRRLLKLDE
jgi:Tfp pilus assembly protein PilF